MGIERSARARRPGHVARLAASGLLAAVWLMGASPGGAASNSAKWPDGDAIASALQPPAPASRPPAEAALNEVAGRFVATPPLPVTFGEPQVVVDRLVAESLAAGHWRATSREIEHPDREWSAEAEADNFWPGLTIAPGDDRFRRLRPVADFLRETAPSDVVGGADLPPMANEAVASAKDGWLIRMLKDLVKPTEQGHLITRERLLIAVFAVAALSGLVRLAVRS